MGRHVFQSRRLPRVVTRMLSTVLVVGACAVVLVVWRSPAELAAPPAAATTCATPVQVVTAASFAPVLSALAPALATGEDCARLNVTVADGRAAARQVRDAGADVWIPDDTSWAGVAVGSNVAKTTAGGSGTVVATSPLYFVTDSATGDRITAAGGSWLGLAGLVAGGSGSSSGVGSGGGSGVRLVVRDPAGSGDGLVAAGAVGEAVWLAAGMTASSEALVEAVPATRTVPGTAPALPAADGEVGLVPEYALLGRPAAVRNRTVLAPTDHTAMLRFTWLPTADAAKEPELARALDRMLRTLTGPEAREPRAAAGLRGPQRDAPDAVRDVGLPAVAAAPFEVFAKHHVDHVFATWYAEDRRTDLLLVVDVSGSMAQPAPGSDTPLIDLVAQGCTQVGELLPDGARLALWEFGSRLDPPRDHRIVLPRRPLTAEHRQAFGAAAGALAASQTGTGLNDTLLAAYLAARDGHRPGTPNQVVLFTDGRNQDDPGSITAEELASRLAAAQDPERPVRLTVLTFAPEPDADALTRALQPVGGSVERLTAADEVRATFIHLAAGGLHH